MERAAAWVLGTQTTADLCLCAPTPAAIPIAPPQLLARHRLFWTSTLLP